MSDFEVIDKVDYKDYEYLYDLIEIKYITKERAIKFAENFKKKGKLNEEEYKSIMLLIEASYE